VDGVQTWRKRVSECRLAGSREPHDQDLSAHDVAPYDRETIFYHILWSVIRL
jgi:hypothetical protein